MCFRESVLRCRECSMAFGHVKPKLKKQAEKALGKIGGFVAQLRLLELAKKTERQCRVVFATIKDGMIWLIDGINLLLIALFHREFD